MEVINMEDSMLFYAEKMEEQCINDRRYFHQNPELPFQEKNTMEYITKRLDTLGVSYQSGIAKTGVLAEVHGNSGGKCLLIRADMDALPIHEKRMHTYCSKNTGVMHACGHDAHTAILLSVCELMNQLKTEFSGTIKFVFQPGEETSGGAEPMIAAGILSNPTVDACIALHVDTEIPSGCIRVKEGALYASPDDFYITIKGRGGHGAEPENTIEPITIASELVPQLHALRSDKAVVSVCSIHAGDATNVIPETIPLSGTARSLDNETRIYLEESIESILKDVSGKYNASYSYRFEKLYPPLINHPKISKLLKESAIRCLGEAGCIWGGKPTMAGEDFAYFSQSVPSLLFKLGCRNEEKGIVNPLHNASFDIDESCLNTGVTLFCGFALDFLK